MKCGCGYVPPSDNHVCGLSVATDKKELGFSTPNNIQVVGKLALNTITAAYKIKCWMRRTPFFDIDQLVRFRDTV